MHAEVIQQHNGHKNRHSQIKIMVKVKDFIIFRNIFTVIAEF